VARSNYARICLNYKRFQSSDTCLFRCGQGLWMLSKSMSVRMMRVAMHITDSLIEPYNDEIQTLEVT
jgi:hypothetical protein